jgi:alkylation response protein AidB-like acyl-CoA dehydrogenase
VSAWFPYDDPEAGPVCLGVGVSPAAAHVRIEETWDATGMRGTGSHDLVVEDLYVPDAQVSARRAAGRLDGPLVIMLTHFAHAVSGVYLGLAVSARDAALDALARAGRRAATPEVQRAVGECDHLVATAGWTLDGALARTGDDPAPDLDGLRTALLAKRAVLTAAGRAVDSAVEAVGGRAYLRSSPLERLARDVRAAGHHPLSPEATLLFAGRLALGADASAM